MLQTLWLGFFNATYRVGKQALLSGELSADDVESMEPAVLLGLPALAALECAVISAPHCAAALGQADDEQEDGLLVATAPPGGNGEPTRSVLRPRDFQPTPPPLYDELRKLARQIGRSRLSPVGLSTLRRRTLASSASVRGAEEEGLTVSRRMPDPTASRPLAPCFLIQQDAATSHNPAAHLSQEEENIEINQLVATAQGVSVIVSQLGPYKDTFGKVTTAILVVASS